MTITACVVRDGTVVDRVVYPQGATLQDGTLVIDGGVLRPAADEETIVLSETAQLGWRLTAGELVPPAAAKPPIAERRALMRDAVNIDRAKRVEAGFTFEGKAYDFGEASRERISAKATMAGFAVAQGAQAGNLRWADPDQDFAWIAADNSLVPMDAQTCFAFGQAAIAHDSAHVLAARALKDAIDAAKSHSALDALDLEGAWPRGAAQGDQA